MFYVFDSARLLSSKDLLVAEAGGDRLKSAFSEIPFTVAGRPLYFCPLLRPDRAAFLAAWGNAWAEASEIEAALDGLRKRRQVLWPIRVVATLMFTLLFAVGPLLTLWRGPDTAVLYVAGFVYAIALATGVIVWLLREDLEVTPRGAVWLGVEMVLCPAFVPNLVRRITCRWKIEVDGAQLVLAASGPDVRERLVNRLESRVAELLEGMASDDPETDRLRHYLLTVRAAA